MTGTTRVFILQVSGRKGGDSRRDACLPRRGRARRDAGAGGGSRLGGGARRRRLLYIPRGWWQTVALPLDEPTLHLNVGVHKRTGGDLARWLAERLSRREVLPARPAAYGFG